MKMFKKSTISLALTAAMIGGVALTQQATAFPQLAPANTPYVAPGGLGQVLVFPYYTVENGQKSFFNITNTSDDTLAVKVRFRESLNSRDVLDFNLVMSPNDVWTGWVEDRAGTPVVKTNDNTCLIGGISGSNNIRTTGLPMSTVGYGNISGSTGVFADPGSDTIERTREGYVEVIAMGKADSTAAAAAAAGTNVILNAVHELDATTGQRVPHDCATIITGFEATESTAYPVALTPALMQADTGNTQGDGNPTLDAQFIALTDGENPLKGNFAINNDGSSALGTAGLGAGNAAVAIANFTDVLVGNNGAGRSLLTAQEFPYFMEPTLASRNGLWTSAGLVDVEDAILSQRVINEWANVAATNAGSGGTGAQTDWIFTFPTKSFHVDDKDSTGTATILNIQASVNQWRFGSAGLVGASAGTGNAGTFKQYTAGAVGNDFVAPVTISIDAYDREEQVVTVTAGGVTPSPSPVFAPETVVLNREANIIQFNGLSTLGSTIGTNIDNPVGTETSGYLDITYGDASDATALPDVGDSLPALGYVFKSRTQGSADLNFGQITEHGFQGN